MKALEKRKALVEPRLLKWARESTFLSIDEAAKAAHTTPERFLLAEQGDGFITFRQLAEFAYACRLPMESFYLSEPPYEEPLPSDFRAADYGRGAFTAGLVRILRVARERRDTAAELFEDLHLERRRFPTVKNDAAIVHILRPLMCVADWNLPTQEKRGVEQGAKALSLTKDLVENAFPVLVFEFIIDPAVLRGCSLFSESLSIIVLSTRDNPNARRFTLAHELAHLLMRQSGLCYPIRGHISDATERRCNAVAGESLLPAQYLHKELEQKNHIQVDSLIKHLSARYCLSQSATAIRLNQVGFLGANDLQTRLDLYKAMYQKQRETQAESENGPKYHLLQVQRLGPTFTSAVLSSIENDSMSLTQGAHLLQIGPSYENVVKVRENLVNVYGSR
jgi:Zn-dependent peptidase ImmA (M78 family)